MEHNEFVAEYLKKKIDLAYDTKKASKVFCDAFPEHGLSWVMQYFIKLRQNTYLLIALGLICLISPVKWLVFLVAVYALFQIGVEKLIRKYIEDNMVASVEFYNSMIATNVVFVTPHKKTAQ